MKPELLRVTQKLEVIETDPETAEQDIYFSRIEDVGKETIMITPPFRKGFYLPPRPGRRVAARVVAEKVPYFFETTLVRYVPDQLPLWELVKPTSFRKMQLRENVRLEISLKATLAPLDELDETKFIKTVTKDLSAGGTMVVLSKALPIGEKFIVSIVISQEWTLRAEGEVIRLLPPQPPQEKYFAGIKFKEKDIDDKLQKRLIQFIFFKQAEKRQKEKEWFG
jgi:c-di-GMP-binding flagellar brake protein YcgR